MIICSSVSYKVFNHRTRFGINNHIHGFVMANEMVPEHGAKYSMNFGVSLPKYALKISARTIGISPPQCRASWHAHSKSFFVP